MEPQLLQIGSIPAALWGRPSERVIVAVHGAQSGKADVPFRILAEANPDGQFPDTGWRFAKSGFGFPVPMLRQVETEDLTAVLDYAESRWMDIGLFAVSMGAYFGLLACQDRKIRHAWFLSPVVDMERLTRDMIGCPVCFGENDVFDPGEDQPSDENRGMTLAESREAYKKLGAVREEFLKFA